jgi:hypothetical protein
MSGDTNGTQLLIFSGTCPLTSLDQIQLNNSAPTGMTSEGHDPNGAPDSGPNELDRQNSFLELDTEASKAKEVDLHTLLSPIFALPPPSYFAHDVCVRRNNDIFLIMQQRAS